MYSMCVCNIYIYIPVHHFNRDISTSAHSCKYLIDQFFGSSAECKIMQNFTTVINSNAHIKPEVNVLQEAEDQTKQDKLQLCSLSELVASHYLFQTLSGWTKGPGVVFFCCRTSASRFYVLYIQRCFRVVIWVTRTFMSEPGRDAVWPFFSHLYKNHSLLCVNSIDIILCVWHQH